MYKYVHIMPHESTTYNAEIINMINNDKNFNKSDHLFIIANQQVYNQVKNYSNVIYEKDVCNNMKKFKECTTECNYIFLHSNTLSTINLLILNRKILNKIIWCVWGHDLYSKRNRPIGLYRKFRRVIGNCVRFIPETIRNSRIRKFYAIGIGFRYDVIEVKRKFGKDMKILMLFYGYKKGMKEGIDTAIKECEPKEKKDKNIRVMIGHSAFSYLNHMKVLDKLEKYKDENITISLILSYGDEKYKEEVKQYAYKKFGQKVEIIEEFMPEKDYIKYLNSIDICILDCIHQSAMGNVYRLLYMEKKLFLNKDGIIKLSTELENIEAYNTEDIDHMDFTEFKKPIKEPIFGKEFAKFYINEENYINSWIKTIQKLEQ